MSKAAEANPAGAFDINSNVQEHSLHCADIAQPMGHISNAQTCAHVFIQEWHSFNDSNERKPWQLINKFKTQQEQPTAITEKMSVQEHEALVEMSNNSATSKEKYRRMQGLFWHKLMMYGILYMSIFYNLKKKKKKKKNASMSKHPQAEALA